MVRSLCQAARAPSSEDAVLTEANPDRRRLVLGAAVRMRIRDVRVFMRSLRASGYRGDVVMLVAPYQWLLMAWLAAYRVRTRWVLTTRRLNGPIHAFRFEKFAAYLRAERARYDEVMISDVRDVAFQAHPFPAGLTSGCQFYLEGRLTIGEEPTNRRWATTFLPPDEANALMSCRVSCCGVTTGTAEAMEIYLTRLADHLQSLPMQLKREGGADTVFHNLMVHVSHEAEGATVENNLHVATMGIEPASAYRVDAEGNIRTAAGHKPAILHQYDRVPGIDDAVRARHGG